MGRYSFFAITLALATLLGAGVGDYLFYHSLEATCQWSKKRLMAGSFHLPEHEQLYCRSLYS